MINVVEPLDQYAMCLKLISTFNGLQKDIMWSCYLLFDNNIHEDHNGNKCLTFFVLSSVFFIRVLIICTTLLYCIHIYIYNCYPNKSNQIRSKLKGTQ